MTSPVKIIAMGLYPDYPINITRALLRGIATGFGLGDDLIGLPTKFNFPFLSQAKQTYSAIFDLITPGIFYF